MLAADPADKERAVFDPAELLVLELRTLAVDGSFAVERDIFCVNGADEKHARRFVGAFLEGVELAIVGQVWAAQEGCVFLQPQCDVVFQYDGADQKLSGRHAHHAAPRCARCINRFLNGGRGQRFTIAQHTNWVMSVSARAWAKTTGSEMQTDSSEKGRVSMPTALSES